MLPISAENVNLSDVLPSHEEPMIAELGVIGWDGDDDHAELGTEENGGIALVKVQLLRGGFATDEIKEDVGQGPKILARLSGYPFYAIPPKGTQCLVVFPQGFSRTPGAGVLTAYPGKNPFVQFSKTRAKIDVGPDQDLVLKARSITISDYENRFLAIGPDTGTLMSDKDGVTVQIKDGTVVIMVPDGNMKSTATLVLSTDALVAAHNSSGGAMTYLKLKDGNLTAVGNQGALAFGAVMLGMGASPATASVVAPPGASGAAGIASKSVFVSP